jgi:hypothetical protein
MSTNLPFFLKLLEKQSEHCPIFQKRRSLKTLIQPHSPGSPPFIISSSCDSCFCASQIGVNKASVLTVIISIIRKWWSLKNLGNYRLCYRRHEIKTRNSWFLAARPRLFNFVCKRLVRYLLRKSRLLQSVFPKIWPGLLIGAATRATRKQRTNQLSRCYNGRSLATRCHAGQLLRHTCLSVSEWAGNARARWSSTRRT